MRRAPVDRPRAGETVRSRLRALSAGHVLDLARCLAYDGRGRRVGTVNGVEQPGGTVGKGRGTR